MVYQDPGSGSTASDAGSTTDVAKEQAGRVGQKATEAGGQVAQTTKEQAQQVVGEAKQQARDLIGEARTQVRTQAGSQRDRAVQGLRGFSDELEQMALQGGQSGLAAEVARQLSGRTRELAGHLERNEPSDLLDQVRAYARRRPVMFLAGAALAGVVAGRLTKSLAAGAPDSGARALSGGDGYRPAELPTGSAYASPDYAGAGYQTGAGYESGYATPAYATGTGAGYPTGTGAGYASGAATGAATGVGYEAGAGYTGAEGYPAEGYPAEGYPAEGYPAETYGTAPADDYGNAGYRQDGEGEPGYPAGSQGDQPPARGWNP